MLGIGAFMFLLLILSAFAAVQGVSIDRQHVVRAVETAEQQTLTAATADPDLASGNAVLNATLAASLFPQNLGQDLQSFGASVTVNSVQVLTQAEVGAALPGNMPGTVAGPGLYVSVSFPITILPFGNPGGGAYTLTETVQVVTAANRFNQPQVHWIPG